jgi:uncharacterized coiled-coil protein SlyX
MKFLTQLVDVSLRIKEKTQKATLNTSNDSVLEENQAVDRQDHLIHEVAEKILSFNSGSADSGDQRTTFGEFSQQLASASYGFIVDGKKQFDDIRSWTGDSGGTMGMPLSQSFDEMTRPSDRFMESLSPTKKGSGLRKSLSKKVKSVSDMKASLSGASLTNKDGVPVKKKSTRKFKIIENQQKRAIRSTENFTNNQKLPELYLDLTDIAPMVNFLEGWLAVMRQNEWTYDYFDER